MLAAAVVADDAQDVALAVGGDHAVRPDRLADAAEVFDVVAGAGHRSAIIRALSPPRYTDALARRTALIADAVPTPKNRRLFTHETKLVLPKRPPNRAWNSAGA